MSLREKLSAPFSAMQVSWRVGATSGDKTTGIALAYLDARDVMERLDEACGFDGWQCRYNLADAGLLICEIGIRIDSEWLWRANGAGDSQVEPEKGKCSDAFKRAAVLWGVGRYLYDLPNTWFPIQQHGRSYSFTGAAKAEMTQRLAKWQEQYFARRETA